METRAGPHHAWLHTAAQTWLFLVGALTLLLSGGSAEAATSYRFTPVTLNVGEDPLQTLVIIRGMKSTGMLVGQYVPEVGPGGTGRIGFRGLGSAFRMFPLLLPEAINEQNAIVGNFTDPYNLGAPEAGFVINGTTFQPISIVGASVTRAYGVNNAGTIVGGATLMSDGRGRAFRLDADGTLTWIDPPFGTALHYTARSINNRGDIVGQQSSLGWALIGGVYTQIQMPGNDGNTLPLTINDNREIGGYFCRLDETCSGFILSNGVYQQIDVPGAFRSEVVAIHPKTGTIAVNADVGDDGLRGYLGTKGTGASSR
jgi:hypothetical protein